MKRTTSSPPSPPRLALRRQAVRILTAAELGAAGGFYPTECGRESARPCCPSRTCMNEV